MVLTALEETDSDLDIYLSQELCPPVPTELPEKKEERA